MISLLSAETPELRTCTTLPHVLQARARLHPDSLAYTYLNDGEVEEHNLTFAALDQRARALAAELCRLELQDSRALIVYEPGLDYLIALFGCFYARVVAVPVYPPDPMRAARTLTRLQSIMDDAEPRVLLTTSHLRSWADSLPAFGGPLERVLFTDELDFEATPSWDDPGLSPETVALLQYTSGSTTAPRGCVITHGNLIYNFQHIQQFDEPDAVAVSWLPMYHDMGLIGLALQTAHGGRRLVFMSPLAFVQSPIRWLKAISKYRAYATASPNFGYELCVRKIKDEEIDQLDLSCWTLACNGAEPVRHDTLERFARRFARCGFRREAFYPCYGLAEATLIVTGGGKYDPPVCRSYSPGDLARGRAVAKGVNEGGRMLVGCGRPVGGTSVQIVDPESGALCADGQIGEIRVQGPGVAQRYWNRGSDSQEVFRSSLNGHKSGLLCTGDLGFRDGGELFVVGRKKDLIILHGKNHYPQDIEATVWSCHPALRRDAGAAFSVDIHNQERLVVVQEVVRPRKTNLTALLDTIRSEIIREHEIAPHAIVLIKGGTLPKTSSGKVQRRECRQRFLAGELDVAAERIELNGKSVPGEAPPLRQSSAPRTEYRNGSPSRDELFHTVCHLLREVAPDPHAAITLQTRLFGDLGLASIDAVMLQGLVEEHFQRRFPFDEFMAELGRREARDAQVSEFVTFLHDDFQQEVAT